MLTRYRAELDAEISDPARLAATYGSAFATSDMRRQAKVVAMMANTMLCTPNAMVSIMGEKDQEVIAADTDPAAGPEPTGFTITESFCKHVIGTGRELAIDDASQHQLVCDTQQARNGQVLSYLGVPIADRSGIIVGVLCVWDTHHHDWGTADVVMLTQLSAVLTRSLR